ncbi:MAG: N-acetyltransferase [Propionibacteriaceae bacterium]|jgi:predicted GNAT family acetyltransferase|nr:N-acetyltransferase [Propionibacteriaceae bacterium]
MAVSITHDTTSQRYVAWVDDVPAGLLEYRQRGRDRALVHTLVEPLFEGHGVGGALVKTALEEARADGFGILPYCPFVHAYLAKHPGYLDLVPVERRAAFDLPAASPVPA